MTQRREFLKLAGGAALGAGAIALLTARLTVLRSLRRIP